MGSMRAGPAASASEVPRKPRRASIRSLRENSLSRATVWGPVQGRSTPDTEGDWCAERRPMSSTATTLPNRSEKSSERMRGIGSRGCSPSSQRRTREVSVLMWCAPIWRALRFTWRASSPFDQPLRTNHEPSCSFGRFPAFVPPAPLPPTGTPPSTETSMREPVTECRESRPAVRGMPLSNTNPACLRHTRTCRDLRGVHAPKVILRSPIRHGVSINATIRHPFE